MGDLGMIVKKEAAKVKDNTPGTRVWEYFTGEIPSLGLAVAEIDGFYPSKEKWACNTGVDEMYYVMHGSAQITFEGEKTALIEPGDAVLIKKGAKFRVEGRKLKIVVPTSPSWYPEQHKYVD